MKFSLILLGFVSQEKKIVLKLFEYVKGISCDVAKMLEESDIEGCLNVDCDASIVYQLTDGKIMAILLDPLKDKNRDSNVMMMSADLLESISMDKYITMIDDLVLGVEEASLLYRILCMCTRFKKN